MIIVKKHLSRRTFMRGTLGATMALPFLDAMAPALTAQAKAPFRFGVVYMSTAGRGIVVGTPGNPSIPRP